MVPGWKLSGYYCLCGSDITAGSDETAGISGIHQWILAELHGFLPNFCKSSEHEMYIMCTIYVTCCFLFLMCYMQTICTGSSHQLFSIPYSLLWTNVCMLQSQAMFLSLT
ncbi:hypothetical protein GOODEAATRI_018043 [Goodea atripinnis]|uniref:Uncharacterized protein n=1 Tax=Goodea atripinnis TaxID=208336 RepID=A0ABV0MT09_9TELE